MWSGMTCDKIYQAKERNESEDGFYKHQEKERIELRGGKLFHNLGLATENARSLSAFTLVCGMSNICSEVEQRVSSSEI